LQQQLQATAMRQLLLPHRRPKVGVGVGVIAITSLARKSRSRNGKTAKDRGNNESHHAEQKKELFKNRIP